eukprot:3090660-Pleurochrysis_carterae.AAC.2
MIRAGVSINVRVSACRSTAPMDATAPAAESPEDLAAFSSLVRRSPTASRFNFRGLDDMELNLAVMSSGCAQQLEVSAIALEPQGDSFSGGTNLDAEPIEGEDS